MRADAGGGLFCPKAATRQECAPGPRCVTSRAEREAPSFTLNSGNDAKRHLNGPTVKPKVHNVDDKRQNVSTVVTAPDGQAARTDANEFRY